VEVPHRATDRIVEGVRPPDKKDALTRQPEAKCELPSTGGHRVAEDGWPAGQIRLLTPLRDNAALVRSNATQHAVHPRCLAAMNTAEYGRRTGAGGACPRWGAVQTDGRSSG